MLREEHGRSSGERDNQVFRNRKVIAIFELNVTSLESYTIDCDCEAIKSYFVDDG